MLWAVANTLTVFAIRHVGLSIAFPLWNVNSLVGVFWGWLLFNELRGGESGQRLKVLGGAAAIVVGACVLAWATATDESHVGHGTAALGILAALGAALLWGTMYIPYRKAYLSGMNPLSFVTVFTFGELGTMFALAACFDGGVSNVLASLQQAKPALFWLFLGGFCWVLGDLFQQYAAKYIGISRGIPLSNTNQLWGLAWGVLVFGELAHMTGVAQALVVGGSLIMIAGSTAISFAEAPADERHEWQKAMERECVRYGLDRERAAAALTGSDPLSGASSPRRWWELLIVAAAIAIFLWLGSQAQRQAIAVDTPWLLAIAATSLIVLVGVGILLFRRTRFS
jgi:drug/metabolite transporter (DMT)-like permease